MRHIQFKKHFGEKHLLILLIIVKTLTLKMHQELSVYKTLELKNNNKNDSWGHIQRSGKVTLCVDVIEDSKNKTVLFSNNITK